MAELRNLDVEWLSLVDRAAVRDPSDPTEPQKFLLWKREAGAPDAEPDPEPDLAALQATITKVAKKITKVQDQIDKLTKTDPPPAAAEEAMIVQDDAGDKAEDATPQELAAELAKDESPEALAEQLSKAERGSVDYRAVGEAYLRQMSPQAHAAWLAGRAGATYATPTLAKSDAKPIDSESLKAVAEEIRKSDPGLSAYDAMIKAMRGDRDGQLAYLQQARGR